MPEYKLDSVVAFLNTLYSFIYMADFEGALSLYQQIRWKMLLPKVDTDYIRSKYYDAKRIYDGWFRHKANAVEEWQRYLDEQESPI